MQDKSKMETTSDVMKTPKFDLLQLVDTLSVGIIVLDRGMKIVLWNRWMEEHSKINKNQALGMKITDLFPDQKIKGFNWKVQAVFKLGHFSFFPQEHYKYLFHFPNHELMTNIEEMQQNCIVSPLKDKNGVVEYVALSVYDVTNTILYQQQLIEAKKSFENLSLIDELTTVYNRRHLLNRLKEEFARYSRNQQLLSFLLIDIDFFKSINDTWGHLAGDHVLKMLCQFILLNLREYDVLGRYGGEEFGIILPNTNLDISIQIAERCRKYIETADFIFQQNKISVTISIGAAEANQSIKNIEKLINNADEALYGAKQSGRNKVGY